MWLSGGKPLLRLQSHCREWVTRRHHNPQSQPCLSKDLFHGQKQWTQKEVDSRDSEEEKISRILAGTGVDKEPIRNACAGFPGGAVAGPQHS